MKFETYQERMHHPQGSLIPLSVWEHPHLFDGELPDTFIPLMTAKEDALLEIMANTPYKTNSEKNCAGLAIAYSHPELSPLVVQKIFEMMNLDDTSAVFTATAFGNLDYFRKVDESLIQNHPSDKKLKKVAFELAARLGHLNILKYLVEQTPDKSQAIIAENYSAAFKNATFHSHFDVLQYLEEKDPEKFQKMIPKENYLVFQRAAKNGDLDLLKFLEAKAPKMLQEMIAEDEWAAFGKAAEHGHLHILELLEAKAPGMLQKMIAADGFSAFRNAAENGHLHILEYLEAKGTNTFEAMNSARQYSAFASAANNGHLHILEYLAAKAPSQLQEMIKANGYNAFQSASRHGHLHILKYLVAKAPDQLQEMIEENDYTAYVNSAKNGYLNIIEYLEATLPHQLQEMIKADDYGAFQNAAQYGHLRILEHLVAKAPDQLQEMIETDDYGAFKNAAQYGHLDILKYLEAKAPGKLQEIITQDNYALFENAVKNGHLDILKYLEEYAPDKLQGMIEAGIRSLSWAHDAHHLNVVKHLLSYSRVFNHVEQHEHEYGEQYTHPFIAKKLNTLRTQKAALEQENPNAVFDIQNEDEAKVVFYMIRNLIRQNPPDCRDDLIFLLEIPAVKALAHTEVTEGIPNELLRLTLTQGNRMAAELLLNIPAVRELAEQHQFYGDEVRGRLDLSALARDRESSMTALTQGEQQRLQEMLKRYEPLLTAQGTENITKDLRQMLETRYKKNSATILVDGEAIPLPLDWPAFKALNLTDDKREMALRAYYQHKDHSAWRYLSKPNPWMHEAASYVYVNPDSPTERWSTFEEYLPLISVLFLAAADKETPAINGYTLDARIEHFIDELAHIARAHNWDDTRFKVDAEGLSLLDEHNNPVTEEYDNLEGDRPSCFSGVKRRLFQAVQGHPLLVFLTQETLEEEVRDFVRDHWKNTINKDNQEALRAAWDNVIEGGGTEEDIKKLQCLDVPPEAEALFKAQLITKYGDQLAKEPAFIAQITKPFLIKAQVLNLGHLNPEQLFGAEPTPKATASQVGFFADNHQDHLGEVHSEEKGNDEEDKGSATP